MIFGSCLRLYILQMAGHAIHTSSLHHLLSPLGPIWVRRATEADRCLSHHTRSFTKHMESPKRCLNPILKYRLKRDNASLSLSGTIELTHTTRSLPPHGGITQVELTSDKHGWGNDPQSISWDIWWGILPCQSKLRQDNFPTSHVGKLLGP